MLRYRYLRILFILGSFPFLTVPWKMLHSKWDTFCTVSTLYLSLNTQSVFLNLSKTAFLPSFLLFILSSLYFPLSFLFFLHFHPLLSSLLWSILVFLTFHRSFLLFLFPSVYPTFILSSFALPLSVIPIFVYLIWKIVVNLNLEYILLQKKSCLF